MNTKAANCSVGGFLQKVAGKNPKRERGTVLSVLKFYGAYATQIMVRRGKVHPKPLKNPSARHGSFPEAFNTAKVFALHGNSGRESNHAQEFLPHLVPWPLRRPRPDHAPRKPRSPRGTQPHPGIPSCALPPKPLRRTTTCGWREAGQAKTKENRKKTKERKQRSPATRRDSFLCPTPLANAASNHVRLEGGRPGQTKERPKKTKKTKEHRRGIHPGIPSCALPPWPSRRMTTCSRRGGRPG